MPRQTPSQTVGPFFQDGLFRGAENVLIDAETQGQEIRIFGTLLDGQGAPVPDGVVELWQADAGGHFRHSADPLAELADPHFHGFGRSDTRSEGRFEFVTIKPGRVANGAGELQAPHVALRIFARGLLVQLDTRMYFPDQPEENNADPLLRSLDPARRASLIAERVTSSGVPTYRLDIHLQGPLETVFFEY